MRFGTTIPQYQYSLGRDRSVAFSDVTDHATAVEAGGWDSLWVSDHLWLDLGRYGGDDRRYDAFECLTTLGVLARTTSRLRIGTLVTCVQLRPPALLAKSLTSLDVTSGGRIDVGLGAGWYEPEFLAAGVPFLGPRERLEQLDEAAHIVGEMLRAPDPPVTFAGHHYQVTEAWNSPPPVQRPRPPLWIGGKGDRLLAVATRRADGWNTTWLMTPERYRERLAVAHAACAAVDRDPATLRLSLGLTTLVAPDEAGVRAAYDAMRARQVEGLAGEDLAAYRQERLVGTVDQVVDTLGRFAGLGVEEIICNFGSVPYAYWSPESFECFTTDVLPQLR